MKQELDVKLVEKYPKIFKNRYASMQTTAMCWGVDCGDGWYNILNVLCANIQRHIDASRNKRAYALRKNRALKRALIGDRSWLIRFYMKRTLEHDPEAIVPKWVEDSIINDMKKLQFTALNDIVPQVVASQVKEKFGGLRFYVEGGDDVTSAMIDMAESLSVVTCEECGSPGRQRGAGWIVTLCDKHAEERSIYTTEEEDKV